MAFSSLFRRITTSLLHPGPSPAPSFSRSFAASASKDGKNARKQHKGLSTRGLTDGHIAFGRYALQCLDYGRLTTRQIEAGRRAISRLVQRGGKIWVRVVADKPVSGKAVGIRMGKGKGAIQYWTSVVKPGKLIYELDGVPEFVAKRALAIAGDKMPLGTRIVMAS